MSNIRLSRTLDKMYQAALHAESENSVIHQSSEDKGVFESHKWQRLGTRTDDFKLQNKEARRILLTSVSEEFGGLARIPKAVLDVLKLEDFQVKGKVDNQYVSSCRPLTSRRIKLICEAVKDYKNEHRGVEKGSAAFFDTLEIPGYEELTDDLRTEYRAWVTENTGLKDIGRLVYPPQGILLGWKGGRTVARFLLDKCKADIEQLGKLGFKDAVEPLEEVFWQRLEGKPLSDEEAGRKFKAYVQFLKATDVMKSAQSKIGQHVLDATHGLSAKQQAYALGQLMVKPPNGGGNIVDEFISRATEEATKCVNDNLDGTNTNFSYNTVIRGLSKLKVDDIKALANCYNPEVDLGFEAKHAFMSQYIDRYKDEFSKEQGRQNEQYNGSIGNKFENIADSLRVIKKLKDDSGVKIRNLLEGAVNDVKEAQADPNSELRKDAQEMLDESRSAYEARKQKAQTDGVPFTEKFDEKLFYPCSLTQNGRSACEAIEDITGVSSHEDINTPAQMLEAFDLYTGVVDDFFLALEKDAQKEDHAMFDALMEALNTMGCLEKRSADLESVHSMLVFGKKLIDFSPSFNAMQGLSATVQMLQEGDENKQVEYADLVDKYVGLMATQKSHNVFVPGTTKFGYEIPALQLKADTNVTITRDFLMQKEVADVLIKDVFDGFIKPLADQVAEPPQQPVQQEEVANEPAPPQEEVANEPAPPPQEEVVNEPAPPPVPQGEAEDVYEPAPLPVQVEGAEVVQDQVPVAEAPQAQERRATALAEARAALATADMDDLDWMWKTVAGLFPALDGLRDFIENLNTLKGFADNAFLSPEDKVQRIRERIDPRSATYLFGDVELSNDERQVLAERLNDCDVLQSGAENVAETVQAVLEKVKVDIRELGARRVMDFNMKSFVANGVDRFRVDRNLEFKLVSKIENRARDPETVEAEARAQFGKLLDLLVEKDGQVIGSRREPLDATGILKSFVEGLA